jgi:cytochrome c oxidase assembly protein subunit 15
LPDAISVSHATLAQTFFVLTIIIAYSQSQERALFEKKSKTVNKAFLRFLLFFIFLIYLQLILGAIMRHTGSGLAIPDFPTMGGQWVPALNQSMVNWVNAWRFDHGLDSITLKNIMWHLTHRIGAGVIFVSVCFLNWFGFRGYKQEPLVIRTLYYLDIMIAIQITLGIVTVLSLKSPILTSLHVANGAAVLGVSVLLFLRAAPLSWSELKREILK